MKVFLICSVRERTSEMAKTVDKYVEELESKGYEWLK